MSDRRRLRAAASPGVIVLALLLASCAPPATGAGMARAASPLATTASPALGASAEPAAGEGARATPTGPTAAASPTPPPVPSSVLPPPAASPAPVGSAAPAPGASAVPGVPGGGSASPSGVPAPVPSPSPTPAPLLPWTTSPRIEARLQAALDEMRAEARIPGISATIAFPDGTVWSGTSGLADVARGRPVTDDTAFSVASISKTFLAALALELSVEGTIRLDTPVATYLPGLRLDPAITVRMLLNHTSGLADFFLNPRIDVALQADRDRGWTPRRTLSYVQRPMFEPGEGWDYSNTNYLLLGMLVERVTARPLAELFRARFFEPLDLASTYDQMAEQPRGPVAFGYRLKGEGDRTRATGLADGTRFIPFRSVVTAARGAGSLAGTSRDVATWARSLYGGAAVSPESLRLMLARVRLTEASLLVPYGMGVQIVPIDGRPALGHSGRFLGFRSVMRYLRPEGVAIAVLTNQNRVDPAPIAARLLRIADPNRGRTPPPAGGRYGGATAPPSPAVTPGPVPSAP